VGISRGTSRVSRWFAGISTVCSMVMVYSMPQNAGKSNEQVIVRSEPEKVRTSA
jgi:hypothetical protein